MHSSGGYITKVTMQGARKIAEAEGLSVATALHHYLLAMAAGMEAVGMKNEEIFSPLDGACVADTTIAPIYGKNPKKIRGVAHYPCVVRVGYEVVDRVMVPEGRGRYVAGWYGCGIPSVLTGDRDAGRLPAIFNFSPECQELGILFSVENVGGRKTLVVDTESPEKLESVEVGFRLAMGMPHRINGRHVTMPVETNRCARK